MHRVAPPAGLAIDGLARGQRAQPQYAETDGAAQTVQVFLHKLHRSMILAQTLAQTLAGLLWLT